jgi:molecular chaperone GrpE
MMSIKQEETRREATKAELEPSALTEDEASRPNESKPEEATVDKAEAATDLAEARLAVLETELAAVREELSSVNDKYLRKLADDVNFRKRMAREKEEGQRYAVAAILGDLIPVLDDFDRAIKSAELQKDYEVLHDGVAIIRRQLSSVLETKYGLVRYQSREKPFDPNLHEAVAMIQGGPEDGDEAIVDEEFLPGYGLHDRILRTAKVRVRMPASKAQSTPPSESVKGSAPEVQVDSAVADKNAN